METGPRNETSFPLHEAVESGNLEVLNTLLDNGGDINVENDNGDTLLHVAVNRNDHQSQEMVTLLLERGANPGLRNRQGNTPLILAVIHNPKCVPLILRNGSGKDTVNIPERKTGITALHLALRKISRYNQPYWSFQRKALDVYHDVTNQLLMHGAEVNSKDNYGNTPLHMARNVECVRMLLDKGALVNSRNSIGQTPLHEAINVDSFDVAHELLMHGAEVNSKDDNGNTPLHEANVECVRLLLDKGALVNSRNSDGKTPLHMLSMLYKDEAYELLLHGADVNSKDNYGNTPLHTTCKTIERILEDDLNGLYCFKNSDCLTNIMLDWGASLTTKDNKGQTPSDIFPDLLDWAKPHNVKKACLKISDIPCEELELKSYWISCLEEVARLKLVRFGKNSLYDIFGQYSDSIFLSNEPLQKAVNMNNCEKEFPIYCYLLQSTYKLAEKRSCMLEDAADTLQTPLPREITWYILTFVDDDSLRNVIRAKDAKQLVERKGHE